MNEESVHIVNWYATFVAQTAVAVASQIIIVGKGCIPGVATSTIVALIRT